MPANAAAGSCGRRFKTGSVLLILFSKPNAGVPPRENQPQRHLSLRRNRSSSSGISMTRAAEAEPFVETKEYRRFQEFCDACRKYRYIGLCYGPPGVGKTLSARHYAIWDWDTVSNVRSYAHRNDPHIEQWLAQEDFHGAAVFYTAPVTNSPRQVDQHFRWLRSHLRDLYARHGELRAAHRAPATHSPRHVQGGKPVDPTELIVVDEADQLKMASLEQLRAIFDRGGIGMVLIGMPGLEKRLARYAQLYSRVGFVHEFRELSPADIKELLREGWKPSGVSLPRKGLADEEAIATIFRITEGNFRLLHRLLIQIGRVLEINRLDKVTIPVVEAARENLVIGTA